MDGNFKAKLGDFGFSKIMNSIASATRGVGTFTHMAPEHITAKESTIINPFSADVYRYLI